MSPDDLRHGKNAGYIAHVFAKQKPCSACLEAHATYARDLRTKRYLKRTDRLHINPIPTKRRIQALAAIGYTWDELNVRLGYKPGTQRISRILIAKAVHVDTEAKVAALYEELHMTPGPSSITRARAASKGWAPPAAYDDISDVTETPKGLVR